jgi:predicted glycoside hydrolase/deacetylase ChbG (UPF0249 family)
MTANTHRSHLIVNADDYGYFRCVSQGILEAAARGIVKATGVIANRDNLEEQTAYLEDCMSIDAGVHLNLTTGTPLTAAMRAKCSRWAERFPGKYVMSVAVMLGAITRDEVASEWRAQIERCLAAGLKPKFLNSHEHVHMLPLLFGVTTSLAEQYGIVHVRFTTAERPSAPSAGALLRNGVMAGLQMLSARKARRPAPSFLGLQTSGRIDEAYFRRVVPALEHGRIYELMCHPGRLDRGEVRDPRLLGYHDWEGELATLTSAGVRDLLAQHGVSVIGYRDLDLAGDRLVVRTRSSVHAAQPH